MIVCRLAVASTLTALTLLACGAHAADAAPDPLFATVNGKTISQKDFHAAYGAYLRQKYYHGQVPEGKLLEARQEVSDRLVDRILLLDDAKRRGLAADEKRIEQTIAEYDARYGNSAMWQQGRDKMLPGLKQQLAEQDLLQQMEAIGHAAADPTDADVRDFYKAKPELFTQPEKLRLHTILLKVDPTSPKAIWDAAREEAARIVARLNAGTASFDELARLSSNDASGEKGGDMGYLHRGMIPEYVQKVLDERPLGSVGEPVDVLEGVAVFRLDEKIPGQLMPYDSIAERARELLKRERAEQAWSSFLAQLRKNADIKFVESAKVGTANVQ